MRKNILIVLSVLVLVTLTAMPAASIGDYVWNDVNKNGIQDDGETGINGVKVELFYGSGNCYMESNECASRITTFGYGKNGFYVFEGAPQDYLYVKFNLPEGYVFSPKDQGSDDAIDSDADLNTGLTEVFYHGTAGDLTRDAGMYRAEVAPTPAIDITKYTNGDDANTVPGPSIPVGSTVTWKYDVVNTGNVPLTNVRVTDDIIGDICTIGDLAVGETKSCAKTGTAVEGQYSNIGTVTGAYELRMITDNDPSNYFGTTPSPGTGTPGYWKNHPEAWPVDSIMIGGITYTKNQAIAIIAAPVKGDKTYTMFQALVSAKLNVIIGNPDSCIADSITSADAWMGNYPVGSKVEGSSQEWKDGEPLYIKMDNYNNGLLCAQHRD